MRTLLARIFRLSGNAFPDIWRIGVSSSAMVDHGAVGGYWTTETHSLDPPFRYSFSSWNSLERLRWFPDWCLGDDTERSIIQSSDYGQTGFMQDAAGRLTTGQDVELHMLTWACLHNLNLDDEAGLIEQDGAEKLACSTWNSPSTYD